MKVFTWLAIVVARTLAYLSMCCDSISKRAAFLWTLVATTVAEAAMFTVMNLSLFDGSNTEVVLRLAADWGMGSGMQIFFFEALSVVHLALFVYFCTIAFEYYTMARDDPAMIDAEHAQQAAKEKKAAAERKRAELAR